ncbi:putative toxin-antitoxin system toxin component, PIN family [Dyadobacter sp. CY343]|uniref:putative toxin-antitoxin system toxin component, PIN family n=1 Tax=Dyadobacter sp. CY343 TaxID=2907299 RepID=UPI001F28AF2B|nr:putative toxin-antitoxin system toxin component, PIN family [Dyadobacter sp. CY343]MCE7062100.1 putative toxin-antitoxin system toxin component, PIN family [Dyadobacter sp. CY343]
MIRIVIDTNLYISAFINTNSRNRLNAVFSDPALEILVDPTLLSEIFQVINRPKFTKYVTASQINSFMELISERCTFVFTTISVKVSPDPKDDFLLALSQEANAQFLLTGNKVDLLELKTFGNTRILTLTEFLDLRSMT